MKIPKLISEPGKERSWYETLCNYFGGTFRLPLKAEQLKNLSDKLEFCGLHIKPDYIYTTAIILAIVG